MQANRRAQSWGVCVWTDPLTIGHDYRKRVRDVWKSACRVNGLLADDVIHQWFFYTTHMKWETIISGHSFTDFFIKVIFVPQWHNDSISLCQESDASAPVRDKVEMKSCWWVVLLFFFLIPQVYSKYLSVESKFFWQQDCEVD